MSFLSEFFDDCLTEKVVIKSITGRNRFGEPTYGRASTFACRLVNKTEEVRGDRGVINFVNAVMWIDSTRDNFNAADQVTLPDGSTPSVLTVETFRDEGGVTHTKIRLGERVGEQVIQGSEQGA